MDNLCTKLKMNGEILKEVLRFANNDQLEIMAELHIKQIRTAVEQVKAEREAVHGKIPQSMFMVFHFLNKLYFLNR